METSGDFNLRWNDFESNTRIALRELREEKVLLDVTLVASDGRQVQANKVVLAAGSTFFHKIITENPHPHPLIYLKGVSYKHLLSVLDYLYTGEARIAEENLNQFMDVAEDLKIKGLIPPKLQTKSNPSSTTTQNQGTTEDPVLSPSSTTPLQSQATNPAPQFPVDVKENVTSVSRSHHNVISAPIHGQSAAEPPAIYPTVSCHNVMSSPLQYERDDTLQKVIREGQDNYVKVEVSDAAQENVFYGMNDEPFMNHVSLKSLHGNKEKIVLKRNFSEPYEKYQNEGMGLSGSQEQDGDVFSKKPKIKIMNSEQIHGWYEGCEENNTMIPNEKEDYFDDEWGEYNTGNEDHVVGDGDSFCTKTFATTSGSDEINTDYGDDKLILTKSDEDKGRFREIVSSMIRKNASNDSGLDCLVCGKQFNGMNPKTSATSHVDHMHTDHLLHKCHVCGEIKNTNFGLTNHLKLHRQNGKEDGHFDDEHTTHEWCECNICTKTFATTSELENHKMSQSSADGRPVFRDPSDLLHYVEKTGQDTVTHRSLFECTICRKAWANKHTARNHVESIHFPSSFVYNCHFCERTFNSLNTRNVHHTRDHK